VLPEKGVPSAVLGTVHRWCQDYAAGLEESSTGEVPRLHKFCRHNYWVFTAPRKSKRQLTTESAEYCQTRDGSRWPGSEIGTCQDSNWRTRHATLNLTRFIFLKFCNQIFDFVLKSTTATTKKSYRSKFCTWSAVGQSLMVSVYWSVSQNWATSVWYLLIITHINLPINVKTISNSFCP